MAIFNSYVSLPEGNHPTYNPWWCSWGMVQMALARLHGDFELRRLDPRRPQRDWDPTWDAAGMFGKWESPKIRPMFQGF